MNQITAFALSDIGNLEKGFNEDYALHATVTAGNGKILHIGLVCDGVSRSGNGIAAAHDAAEAILTYIQQNPNPSIPHLLIEAVQQGNRQVFNKNASSSYDGYSTVALVVVDPSEKPYGRLYIASVGDSPILLIRQGESKGQPAKIIRLNIEHNVMNQAILDGMTPEEAQYLDKASALTRAIGAQPTVQVDIGFYGNTFDPRVAEQRGLLGMALKENDTIIACSDGITDPNAQDGLPFVREEEFLRYALSNNPEQAAKELMSFAKKRSPHDNLSIAMLLIPGRLRHTVAQGISNQTKGMIATGMVIFLVVIAILGYLLSQSASNVDQLEQERIAQNTALAGTEIAITQTQGAIPTNTLVPTATATLTPSATPTLTPTATPTIRPTKSDPNEVGLQFTVQEGQPPANVSIAEGETIAGGALGSFIIVDNGGENADNPAYLFLKSNTNIELDNITSQDMLLGLEQGGDLFITTGSFSIGGVQVVLANNTKVNVFSQGVCLAAHQQEQQVTFSCYSEGQDACTFEFGADQSITIPPGQQAIFDLTQPQPSSPAPIPYETSEGYFLFIKDILQLDPPNCLNQLVDTDLDGVPDRREADPSCVGNFQVALVNGCPDSDGDSTLDYQDACPEASGPASNRGCPLPPDPDGDGIRGQNDACPNDAGPVTNNGCPTDSDRDGFPDRTDVCPSVAGPDRGCPLPVSNLSN